ncbi:MAG: hypothetical protein ACM3MD_08450 [Betaproteobacteria bacterium]
METLLSKADPAMYRMRESVRAVTLISPPSERLSRHLCEFGPAVFPLPHAIITPCMIYF